MDFSAVIDKRFVKAATCCAFIVFLFAIPLFVEDDYLLHILIVVAINVMLATSLRTITTTGQFSMGHAGFMAVGGYTSALLVMKLGLSFWLALPLAGVAAGLLALIVGYPFVRVKRAYFAMLTLFAGEVIRLVIVQWTSLTGGSAGLLNIPPPDPLPIPGLLSIAFNSKQAYYFLVLILTLIILLFLYRIERTRTMACFLTIEQNDEVAESVGIDTASFKVLSLCIGSFLAGIAGSFYAHYVLVLSPTSFSVLQSVDMLVFVIVGGRRSFCGPILGAVVLTLIPEVFRGLQEYQPFVFAGIVFAIIFCLPAGIVGLPDLIKPLVSRMRRKSIATT